MKIKDVVIKRSSEKTCKILEYLIAVCMLIDGRYICFSGSREWIQLKSGLLLLFLGIVIGLQVLIKSDFQIKRMLKKSIGPVVLICLYFLIYAIMQSHSRLTSLKFMVLTVLFAEYFLANGVRAGMERVLSRYEDLVILIAAASCFFWLLGSILGLIKPTGVYTSYWTGKAVLIKHYYHLYYETQVTIRPIAGIHIIRNSAIFTEAPMAAMNFSLALAIELFLNKRISRKRAAILITAIASTFSTTGIVFVFTVLLIEGAIRYRHIIFQKENKRYLLISIFLLLIAAAFNGIIVISKLLTHSGFVRIDDIAVCLKAWKDHPFFGVGLRNDRAIQSYMKPWRAFNKGMSSAVFQILAQGGLYIAIPYYTAFILEIVKSVRAKNWNRVCFILLVFALLFVMIFTYQYITLFIIVGLLFTHNKLAFNLRKMLK